MDDILSCLIKRQDVYEAQSENRFNNLEDAIVKKQSENEKKTETRFSGIEKQLSALSSAINKKTSQFPQLPSPTFAPLSLASRSQPPHPTSLPQPTFPGVPLPNQQPNLNQVDQAAIANIVSNARTIIGIGPISPAEIEDTGGNTPEDKLFIAAVDYLRKEIGVKNSEIEDADITEVFPAEDPSLQRIYVKFSSREQAELCLHLTRRLKKPELNVVLFIPSQFKQRFNALRNEDYRLRRLTNPLHKTRIEFSDDDLILYACPIGHYRFDQYVVHGLPAVDLAPVRTHPPGRKTKRPRSDSTTPEAADKKKERVISPKHSNEDTDKTEDKNSGDVNEAESLN